MDWITLSEEFMGNKSLISASCFFILTHFLFIGNINHRSILFEFFIVSIFMLFFQVYYTIISFSPWIIITTIRFIGINFIILLMSKIWRCFMKTIFFYISYSIPFWFFSRVDCISNRLFSYNRTVWCFIYFVILINTLLIWFYTL